MPWFPDSTPNSTRSHPARFMSCMSSRSIRSTRELHDHVNPNSAAIIRRRISFACRPSTANVQSAKCTCRNPRALTSSRFRKTSSTSRSRYGVRANGQNEHPNGHQVEEMTVA
jgi:hypothetical protein